jgi:hypothetical protein
MQAALTIQGAQDIVSLSLCLHGILHLEAGRMVERGWLVAAGAAWQSVGTDRRGTTPLERSVADSDRRAVRHQRFDLVGSFTSYLIDAWLRDRKTA